jgi:hypothetical protein
VAYPTEALRRSMRAETVRVGKRLAVWLTPLCELQRPLRTLPLHPEVVNLCVDVQERDIDTVHR